MTVYLLRHGKTLANEKRLYCGSSDIPLSGKGLEELSSYKKTIIYPKADIYASSGMLRAVQTLHILYGNQESISMDELKELDFGDFEMKSYDELKDIPAYIDWINDIDVKIPLNGESKTDFSARVNHGYQKLIELCNVSRSESILAVTHGGVIVNIMETLFPGQKNYYKWQPPCGMGYAIYPYENRYAAIGEWTC